MANKKPHQPEDHPIDKLFRDGMEDRHFPYDEKYWAEAEKTLADFNKKASKGKRNGWWLGGGLIAVIIAVITILIMRHNDNASNDLISNNSTISSPEDTNTADKKIEQQPAPDGKVQSARANQEIKHKDTPALRDEMRKKLREKRADKLADKKKSTTDKTSNKQSQKGDSESAALTDKTGQSNFDNSNNNKANNTDAAGKGIQQQPTEIDRPDKSDITPDPVTPQLVDANNASNANGDKLQSDTDEIAYNQQGNNANNVSNDMHNNLNINADDSLNINTPSPVVKSDTGLAKSSQNKSRKSSIGLKWNIGLQGGFYHTSPQFNDIWNLDNLHIYADPAVVFPTAELSIGMELPNIPITASSGIGVITMQEKSTYQYNQLHIDTIYDYITDTSGLVTDSIPLPDTIYTTYFDETPNTLTYLQIPLLIGYEWTIQKWHLGIATGPVLGLKTGVGGTYETLLPTTFYNRVVWYWNAQPQVSYRFNDHWRIAMRGSLQWQLSNSYLGSQTELKFGLQGLQVGLQYDF